MSLGRPPLSSDQQATSPRGEQMIKIGSIVGSALLDAGEHKIGSIREVFFDPGSGQAQFAIVELAALFGGGGKFHPVPWRDLHYDERTQGFTTLLTKEVLKNSPAYDRAQLSDGAYAWGEQTRRYFGGRPG